MNNSNNLNIDLSRVDKSRTEYDYSKVDNSYKSETGINLSVGDITLNFGSLLEKEILNVRFWLIAAFLAYFSIKILSILLYYITLIIFFILLFITIIAIAVLVLKPNLF